MCSIVKNIYTTNDFYPDKQLELVRITEIHEFGTQRYVLKLRGSLQQICFRNVTSIIGNTITFVVPKQMKGNDKKTYCIELPESDDFEITDSNMTQIPVTVTDMKNANAYYITLQINDNVECDVSCEGDMVLYFSKFCLRLNEAKCSYKPFCCESNHWKWISSILSA